MNNGLPGLRQNSQWVSLLTLTSVDDCTGRIMCTLSLGFTTNKSTWKKIACQVLYLFKNSKPPLLSQREQSSVHQLIQFFFFWIRQLPYQPNPFSRFQRRSSDKPNNLNLFIFFSLLLTIFPPLIFIFHFNNKSDKDDLIWALLPQGISIKNLVFKIAVRWHGYI